MTEKERVPKRLEPLRQIAGNLSLKLELLGLLF
jgi:hypothetical protein